MFRSKRPALSELSSRRSAPVSDSDIQAIQRIARELQIFAGELSRARSDNVTTLLQPTLDALPNAPSALSAWMIRALLVNVLQRIDAHFGPPPHPRASTMARLWRADSGEVVRDVFQKHFSELIESSSTSKRECPKSCGDSRIDRALDYIKAHCSRSSLALGDVSEFVRLSRWHLSRLFTRHVGMRFRDVVRGLRMEKATILLHEDVLTVKEIAAQLGFAHPTEFDRQFKHTFGLTPTEWRARRASRATVRRLLPHRVTH